MSEELKNHLNNDNCAGCGYPPWCCECAAPKTNTKTEGETEQPMSTAEELIDDIVSGARRIAGLEERVARIEDLGTSKHEPLVGLAGPSTGGAAEINDLVRRVYGEPAAVVAGLNSKESLGLPTAADAYRICRELASEINLAAKGLAKARRELEEARAERIEIEAGEMANICEEKDEKDKPRYSNETARKAELKFRLAQDAGYNRMSLHIEELQLKVDADQLELSNLERLYQVEKLALGFWSRA